MDKTQDPNKCEAMFSYEDHPPASVFGNQREPQVVTLTCDLERGHKGKHEDKAKAATWFWAARMVRRDA